MPRSTTEDFREQAEALRRRQREEGFKESLGLAGLEHLNLAPDPTAAEVEDAIVKQPGCYAFWAALRKDAELELAELEDDFRFWYAGLAVKARENGKFKSVTELEDYLIDAHGDEWKKRRAAIREAQHRVLFIKSVTKAWEQKSVLLPSLARLVDREWKDTNKQVREYEQEGGARLQFDDDDWGRGGRREASDRGRSDSGGRDSRRAPL